MRIKKLTPVVIASMLALNLNFVGATQVQAACSNFDTRSWEGYWTVEPNEELGIEGDGVDGVKTYYGLAESFGSLEYDREVLKLTAIWKNKTKNKKLKSKIIKFERLLKKYIPQPYKLSYYKDMDFIYNDLDYTIKSNLC